MSLQNWSLDIPAVYSPVSSVFVDVVYYIDKFLNWFPIVNNILGLQPETMCIGGNLYDLMEKGILSFVIELVNKNPDVKVIPIRFCNKRMYIINDISLTRHILLSKGVERGSNYERLSKFFGYGIFTSIIEDRWRHQRNIIIHLLSNKNLNNATSHLWNKTIEIIERVKGEPVDLSRLLSKIGLILFCDIILGIDVSDMVGNIISGKSVVDSDQWTLSEDIDETLKYINEAVEPISNVFSTRYQKFIYHKTRVHVWMIEVIHRIRTQRKFTGIISTDLLVNEFLNGEEITLEMIQLLISVILGGHETTARLMLGIIVSLLTNDKIINKIRDEKSVILYGTNKNDLPYINMVVEEGLRLFPPVWLISRESSYDITYDGITIPQQTPLLLSPLIIQRNKKIWGNNAEDFLPERFETFNDIKNFFPFVVGKESCPGKHFARIESIIVIQALFQHYNVEIIGEHKLTPYSMGTFRLTKDLSVIITDRS